MPSEARLQNFSIWTMNKQHIKEIICRAKRGKKKIMEKLNRAQKCSILGPQNLGSGGGARAPGAPPWIRTWDLLKSGRLAFDWKAFLFQDDTEKVLILSVDNYRNASAKIKCEMLIKTVFQWNIFPCIILGYSIENEGIAEQFEESGFTEWRWQSCDNIRDSKGSQDGASHGKLLV